MAKPHQICPFLVYVLLKYIMRVPFGCLHRGFYFEKSTKFSITFLVSDFRSARAALRSLTQVARGTQRKIERLHIPGGAERRPTSGRPLERIAALPVGFETLTRTAVISSGGTHGTMPGGI